MQILDDKGKAIYAQYTPINNGCMAIGSRGSRTEASSAPVYAWNIGENRGLGSVPVDRDHNSDFWGKFITNDGNPLGIKDVNVKYKEYSPLTVMRVPTEPAIQKSILKTDTHSGRNGTSTHTSTEVCQPTW